MSQITVKEVKPGVGENKPTIIIDDTGARMSGFQSDLKDLVPGDIIEAELKPKGTYINIVSFKAVQKAAVPGKQAQPPAEASAAEIECHYRIAALESACSLFAGQPTGQLVTPEVVIVRANSFYRWLKGEKANPAPVDSTEKKTEPGKSTAEEDFAKLGRPPGEMSEQEKQKLKDENPQSLIDIGWLGNSLNTLANRDKVNWSEEAVMAYMDKSYGVFGTTALLKAARLDAGRARHFEERVKKALAVKKEGK